MLLWLCCLNRLFLGVFEKLRKATVSFLMSVCPSVRPSFRPPNRPHGTTLLLWTDFLEIWYLSIFRKSVEKTLSLSKIWQENGYFTWSQISTFWSYLAEFFLEWEMFQTEVVESTERHFTVNIFFLETRAVYEIMWESMVETDRPQMTIWRMRLACWVPKATNTHSQYVILIAFPPQKWLHEGASLLCLYIYCPCIRLYFFSSWIFFFWSMFGSP